MTDNCTKLFEEVIPFLLYISEIYSGLYIYLFIYYNGFVLMILESLYVINKCNIFVS